MLGQCITIIYQSQSTLKDFQKFLLPNGQPSSVSLQWYYGVQLKQGKQPCSDSSIKRIINLLHVLYLGLHSSQITKRLNSYPYNFHSFDSYHDFRMDAASKSSFHKWTICGLRSQMSKVIYTKLVTGFALDFTQGVP